MLSSIRSGFVTLTLDYDLVYPDNKLDVSAISCQLIPLAVEMLGDSD